MSATQIPPPLTLCTFPQLRSARISVVETQLIFKPRESPLSINSISDDQLFRNITLSLPWYLQDRKTLEQFGLKDDFQRDMRYSNSLHVVEGDETGVHVFFRSEALTSRDVRDQVLVLY